MSSRLSKTMRPVSDETSIWPVTMDFDVPVVGPGETGELRKRITAPTTHGTHRATYKLSGPAGKFGPDFWVEIVVS